MGDSHADRIRALDGLRGWAALSVVGYHFVWELFGPLFPAFRNPVTATVFNGQTAVLLFFCLSGFVLTFAAWRGNKAHVLRQLVKRHSRLAIPILACTIIVVALLGAGLTAHVEAGSITQSWLRRFLRLDIDACDPLAYAVIRVFFFPNDCIYHPFLWTMSYELWGSVLVLLVALFERPPWLPYAVLSVLSAVLLLLGGPGAAFACFTLGALAALCYRDGRMATMPDWLAWPGLAACFAIAAALPGFWHVHSVVALLTTAILILVATSSGPTRFLSNPVSRFLGRISFPLYLMQFPILITVTSYAVIAAHGAGALDAWTALGIAAMSVALSVLCAWLFLPVERFTAWFGRQLLRWLPATATAPSAPRVAR